MYKVYKNLHNGKWSVASVETGLVVGHADIVLLEDTKFLISESGRQRVLKEKSKNVHAYIVGNVFYVKGFTPFKGRTVEVIGKYPVGLKEGERITYNPYKGGYFFNKITGDKVDNFAYIMLGKEYVVGYRGNSPF